MVNVRIQYVIVSQGLLDKTAVCRFVKMIAIIKEFVKMVYAHVIEDIQGIFVKLEK